MKQETSWHRSRRQDIASILFCGKSSEKFLYHFSFHNERVTQKGWHERSLQRWWSLIETLLFSNLFVFLITCRPLFALWKNQAVPLEELGLWFGWELADCHLCVGGSSQDAGSPLGCHMTQSCIVSAVQTRPVALLLSIWKARGDAHVLVALWCGSESFFRLGLRTAPVDHLSQHRSVSV